MLRVALTGGAASGKSVAAAAFRELGAFVSQSDEVARAMMQPGHAVFDGIVQSFGPGVLLPDGLLNRRELARLAFQEGRLPELNAIVHPAVIAAQTVWLRAVAADHPHAVAVVESALVLETAFGAAAEGTVGGAGSAVAAMDKTEALDAGTVLPWRSRFDVLVVVSAPEAERLERYAQRAMAADPTLTRAAAEDDARRRFATQMPEADKRRAADFLLENDGSVELLRERVGQLYARLLRQAEARTTEAM